MSVTVTYKKQFLIGIFLLFIIIIIIEGIIRVYDYFQPNCLFISSEVFSTINNDIKRFICLDNDDLKWETIPYLHLLPNQYFPTININSHGFRGSEITKEKPHDVYRIFVVGGSTTFGVGATSDSNTIPGYLQKFFDSSDLDSKVEVINAGIPKAYSHTETEYIKNYLLNFEPDLFIIYDGWNDIERSYDTFQKPIDSEFNDRFIRALLKNDYYKTPKVIIKNYFNWQLQKNNEHIFDESNIDDKISSWKENWSKICELSKKENFTVVITLQPLVGTGNKNLTIEEKSYYDLYNHAKLVKNYEKYANALEDLKSDCAITLDLRNVFYNVTNTVYFDSGHTGDKGNQIVAKTMFDILKPIVKDLI